MLGAAQQLFGHCQAQKEEIKRLFQQKLDEVGLPEAAGPRAGWGRAGLGCRRGHPGPGKPVPLRGPRTGALEPPLTPLSGGLRPPPSCLSRTAPAAVSSWD